MKENETVLICDCHSAEHALHYLYLEKHEEIYTSVFLRQHRGFFKRLWVAVKYLFGYKCMYGHFDSFCMNEDSARQLYDYLEGFLDQEEAEVEMPSAVVCLIGDLDEDFEGRFFEVVKDLSEEELTLYLKAISNEELKIKQQETIDWISSLLKRSNLDLVRTAVVVLLSCGEKPGRDAVVEYVNLSSSEDKDVDSVIKYIVDLL